LTPKGSVPLNPEKGCDLERYRDRPLDGRQLFIIADVRQALARDVPRITVNAVAAETTLSSIKIKITWAPVETTLDDFLTTEVDLEL
jgi:phage baseplate assembly protein W